MDQLQRETAIRPDGSYLVRAPAGSGKTSLLTARYLRLLALVEKPEEILAITFTRKAAAEMRARILRELREAREGADVQSEYALRTRELARTALRRDDERRWGLLDSPRRLRIDTIDAFEASLVRRLPLLSHLGMAPSVAEQPGALYTETVREALRGMANSAREALVELLCLFDNNLNTALTSLSTLLEKRDEWLPLLGARPLSDTEAGELVAILEANLRAFAAPVFSRLSASRPANYAGSQLNPEHPSANILANLSGWPETGSDNLPEWRVLGGWFLTDKGELRRTVTVRDGFPSDTADNKTEKNRMLGLLGDLAGYPGFVEALRELRALPDASYTEAQRRTIDALFRFLRAAIPELHVQFALRREVDFTEIALRAIHALESPEGVPSLLAERLDAQIQHLLVDEFQDTSVLQMTLLRRLTENWTPGDGRTLFLVGDPMQSIYGWRNARVDLFLKAWRGSAVGLPALEALQLRRNFRSRRNLVENFNEWLAPEFPAKPDATSGAVSYTEAAADPAEEDPRTDRIRCRGFLSDSLEAEAEWIAEEIERIQKRAENQEASLRIGVLFRKGENAAAVGGALSARSIPFQAIDVEPLASLAVIQDLMTLWNAAGTPEDRLAWLSVLRAPWNALALREIEALTRMAARGTIWSVLPRAAESPLLSDEARARLCRTRTVFKRAFEWRGRIPAVQLLRTLWRESGARRYHADARSQTAARQFFRLLDRLDESGQLRATGALEEALSTLYAPPDPNATDRLQLLTIHKAKGLEFDVVFVPFLNAGNPPAETPPLAWEEVSVADAADGGTTEALLIAPRAAIGETRSRMSALLAERKANREKHERLRVFYVAMTRAREELYLSATIDPKDAVSMRELKPKRDSYLERFWRYFEPAFEQAFREHAPRQADSPSEDREYPRLRRLSAGELPEIPSETVREQIAGVSVRQYRPHGKAETDAAAGGIVFHRLMERMTSPEMLKKAAESREKLLSLVREELRELLPAETQIEPVAERVRRALVATAASEIGAWVFHAEHQDVKSEQSIGYFDGSGWNVSRIDRLFRDSAGMLHVVDFKLVEAEATDEAAFITEQRGAYGEQVEHYARLLQLGRAEPVTVTLYFPLQDLQEQWVVAPRARTA